MCSLHYSPPRFAYRAVSVQHPMPDFPSGVTHEELRCILSSEFEALAASMLLSDEGYIGFEDDENESESGSWYGLSWGCIHRDSLYIWRPRAKALRKQFWKKLARWVSTLGRERMFHSSNERIATFIAFTQPLPLVSFSLAFDRLIKKGLVSYRSENVQGDLVYMYYPTRKLGQAIDTYRARHSN